jgi:hypothetical protein
MRFGLFGEATADARPTASRSGAVARVRRMGSPVRGAVAPSVEPSGGRQGPSGRLDRIEVDRIEADLMEAVGSALGKEEKRRVFSIPLPTEG